MGDQIAPALESPIGARLDQLDLPVQHNAAAADPVLVPERLDAQNAFATKQLAPNHPEKRPAVEQLIDPFRDHAGAMEALSRLAGSVFFGKLVLGPVLQVIGRIATDAQLDE